VIIIAGTVAIRPERRAEAIERGLWMSRLTEAEPGCRRYRFYADLADPERLFLFEEWESEEALRAHFATPHMAEFSRVLPGLVASPPVVMRYDVGEARAL
jgi:quinol monooxygenase YgiN